MTDAKDLPQFRSPHMMRWQAERIYRGVFADAPHPYLILTPDLDIVAANAMYLAATMRVQEQLAGEFMFNAFPDNPNDPAASGVANLSASLARARSSGGRDVMPVQRYDVADPDGVFQRRHWHPVNWPILDDRGAVLALVHHVAPARAPGHQLLPNAERVIGQTNRLREAMHTLLAQRRDLIERADDLAFERAMLVARARERRG
jgi:hypothetical protein